MTKTLLLCCSLLLSGATIAQVNDKFTMAYTRDVTGRPVSTTPSDNVEGSPYLVDEWKLGSVVLKKGVIIKDMQLKFDVLKNKLYFFRDGAMFEFADTVRDFQLNYSDGALTSLAFRNGYPAIDKNTPATFYELLVDGEISLLKYRSKTSMEIKGIDLRVTKKYEDKQQYYIALPGNRIVKIKRDKKSLYEALPEYRTQLTKILEESGVKNEAALIDAIEKLNAGISR